MDGHVAPLADICDIAGGGFFLYGGALCLFCSLEIEFGASTFVDDCHGTGEWGALVLPLRV